METNRSVDIHVFCVHCVLAKKKTANKLQIRLIGGKRTNKSWGTEERVAKQKQYEQDGNYSTSFVKVAKKKENFFLRYTESVCAFTEYFNVHAIRPRIREEVIFIRARFKTLQRFWEELFQK